MILTRFREEFFKKFQNSAAIVLSEPNRLYLSGFASSDGAVVVTEDESYLLVDFRYYEMAKQKVTGFKIQLVETSVLKAVKDLCNSLGIDRVVIEDDYITIRQQKQFDEVFDGFEILCFGDFLSNMRSVKTEKEIDKIIESQKITDAAFSHLLNLLNSNMTENDVAAELEFFMKKNGAQETAFKTICVSGKKSALPHGEPSDVKLTKNSFLTMDFGARLDGYTSDMTRTVVIGKADEEMKLVYSTVLSAQENALSAVHGGVLGKDVDKAARDIIYNAGYKGMFGHSTGHGLGIVVHESPAFSPNYAHQIKENSVLSVEPGIYIEGRFGVRIEDIVVVRSNFAQNLTKSDKKLIEI